MAQKDKTGPCLINRDKKPHERQSPRNRVARHPGKKCLRKIDTTTGEVTYKRVKTAEADELVQNEQWRFCKKSEWKNRNVDCDKTESDIEVAAE